VDAKTSLLDPVQARVEAAAVRAANPEILRKELFGHPTN
jgi:hypothetical protein